MDGNMIATSLLVAAIFATLSGMMASENNRNVFGWSVLGLFFGIFALTAISVLKPKPKH